MTRNLVAAKETVASTRTIGHMGEAFVWNLMGRGNDGAPDRVLNLPTNEAWIEPWVVHLKSLGVRFAADGQVRTAPEAGGVAGAMGRLLAIVAGAQDEGTWPRLKACLADDCQWAFYDLSRNRSAVWCDMKVCGNRQKVRSYRERHHSPHALHD